MSLMGVKMIQRTVFKASVWKGPVSDSLTSNFEPFIKQTGENISHICADEEMYHKSPLFHDTIDSHLKLEGTIV